MRDELARLSAEWETRLWQAHEHEKKALELLQDIGDWEEGAY